MKSTAIIGLIVLLIAPCAAMSEKERAYLDGINDGFYLGQLAWQARGNATAAELHNAEIAKYNAFLNETLNTSEYNQEELAKLPIINDSWLPQAIRQWDGKSNLWQGARAANGTVM